MKTLSGFLAKISLSQPISSLKLSLNPAISAPFAMNSLLKGNIKNAKLNLRKNLKKLLRKNL
jgi:hypothetical protein